MALLFPYLSTLFVFLAIDFVWLAFVARKFYFDRIGPLMLDSPNLAIAVIFYLFYAFGIIWFAVYPALKTGQVSTVLINGALLGLLAYGTYDVTNMATLKGWSWQVVAVDVLWGAILTSTAALAGFFITRAVLQSNL